MANTKVTSGVIKNDAVGADQLASNSVVTASINDNAITTAKIADDAILTAKISNSAITNAKMSSNSVDSDQYVDGSIDTAHIGDGQVTSAKLDTNISVSGELTVGSHLNMGDSDILKMGASGHLQIFHDGTHANIKESGSGDLQIFGDNVNIFKADGSQNLINATSGGAVSLFFAGSTKLATASGGVTVTGTLTADDLEIDSGTLSVDASNNRVGIGTTSPSQALDVRGGAGAGNHTHAIFTGTAGRGLALKSGQTGGQHNGKAIIDAQDTESGGASMDFQIGGNTKVAIDNSGNVGIQESSPESILHIKKAASGSSYSADSADLVIIENDSSAAIDIRTPTGDSGAIQFSDTTRARGAIIYYHSLDDMYFNVEGTSGAMVLNGNGLGIGQTSTDHKLTVNASAFDGIQLQSGGSDCGYLGVNTDTVYVGAGSNLIFHTGNAGLTNGTERMRIASDGKVGIGDQASSPSAILEVNDDGADPILFVHKNSTGVSDAVVIRHGRGLSGFNGTGIDFQRNDGTTVGTVVIGFSSTAYNTSSDYRLKENVTYTWDATTRLKQLKPVRFNFKNDTSNLVDGFLAHEVSSIVSNSVTGEKDAVDSEGNPEYQSIDHSKLVPLLVKTIQELEARITELESK